MDFFRSTRSKLAVLADSDEESSSAGSSDEEDVPSTEPQETQGVSGAERWLKRPQIFCNGEKPVNFLHGDAWIIYLKGFRLI